ncbi:MAG: hypothetical protein ABSA26_07415 [Thermoguttaceae bacterium]|jgi:hypothetical protein
MKFCLYPTNSYHNEISTRVNGRFFAFGDYRSSNDSHLAARLKTALSGILVLIFFLFLPPSAVYLFGDDSQTPAETAKPDLAKDLVGMWTLKGEAEKDVSPQSGDKRVKFFSKKHWSVTQINPKTGDVVFHHGGVYSLDGDDYIETVEYANKSTKYLISKTSKFKIKIEGDTLTLIGIGNPWTEVWKRAD